MSITRRRIMILLTTAMTMIIPLSARPVGAESAGVLATFEGQVIDLSVSWGKARACTSDGITTQCFRTEAEMDRAAGASTPTGSVGTMAACSSYLRLYRSTSYGGAVLQLATQYTFINLSLYGFDNDTSSYRVGACPAYFYDGANGGTPLYPGATGANSSAATMLTGWDNRVSSVYIG